MSTTFKFFALSIWSIFLFFTTNTKAACSDLNYTSIEIVHLGGTNYAYQATVLNTGAAITNATANLSINNITGNFTAAFVNPITNQTLNPGVNLLNFPFISGSGLLSNASAGGVANITTLSISYGSSNCTFGNVPYSFNTQNDWGCTDPTALNYDPNHDLEDGSCLSSYCDVLTLHNVYEIKEDATSPVPYVQLIIKNSSSITLNNVIVTPNITSTSPANIGFNLTAQSLTIPANSYGVYKLQIINNLNLITGNSLILNGNLNVNVTLSLELCNIPLSNVNVNTTTLGCTDPSALNYDIYALIDNGSCLQQFNLTQTVHQPECQGNAGSVELDLTGGTPPYTYNFNSFDTSALLPGTYQFSVTDNSPADIGGPFQKFFWVQVQEPFPFECTLSRNGFVLTANANANLDNDNNNGAYYWLKDEVLYEQTNTHQLTIVQDGLYQCFVKTPVAPNGEQCYSYSNQIDVDDISLNEINEDKLITVFPNPNDGNFTINFNENFNENTTIKLYSIDGKLIYNSGSIIVEENYSLNNLNLPSGFYELSIETEKSVITRKILVD